MGLQISVNEFVSDFFTDKISDNNEKEFTSIYPLFWKNMSVIYKSSLHKTNVNTVFFLHGILPYSDRKRLNTEQNFPDYFLNNFSLNHCIRILWIHVTRIRFYSLDMNLWEYGKLYQYNNVYEFWYVLNNCFCIIPYSHNWYNVVYRLSRIFTVHEN